VSELFWKTPKKTKIPKLFLLNHGEITPTEIAELVPDIRIGKNGTGLLSAHIQPIPELNLLLLTSEKGHITFDGSVFEAAPSLDFQIVGNRPSVLREGGRLFLQSSKGVFKLSEDLSVEKVSNFPVDEPWRHQVSINYYPKLRRYIINDKRSGKVFSSEKLETFSQPNWFLNCPTALLYCWSGAKDY